MDSRLLLRRLPAKTFAIPLFFLAIRTAGAAPCPALFPAIYHDAALDMTFAGTSVLAGIENGDYVYHFVGRNTVNEMRIEGYHRVALSQCEAAFFALVSGIPGFILEFYSNLPPQWFSDPPNVACAHGDGGGGATNTMVPTPLFDCVLTGGGGSGDGGGGGWGGFGRVVTVTTCHYTAYFDGNGRYLYSELEYCEEYSYVL